jgi:hypothetical protein
MKITTQHEANAETRAVTVEIGPADDPDGVLADLVTGGGLEAFLRVYAGADVQDPEEDPGLAELLTRYGKVATRAEAKLDELMTTARESAGYSWRTIAAAVDMHQSTVRNRVRKTLDRGRIRHVAQQIIG